MSLLSKIKDRFQKSEAPHTDGAQKAKGDEAAQSAEKIEKIMGGGLKLAGALAGLLGGLGSCGGGCGGI